MAKNWKTRASFDENQNVIFLLNCPANRRFSLLSFSPFQLLAFKAGQGRLGANLNYSL